MAKRKKRSYVSPKVQTYQCPCTEKPTVQQSTWERVGKFCNSPVVGILLKCVIYGKDLKRFVVDLLQES
jgi:hypothetical protein